MMILSVDPGETTGLVWLDFDGEVTLGPSTDVKEETIERYSELLSKFLTDPFPIDMIVVEDYRVYKGYAEQHIGNRLFTAELIGAIRAISWLHTDHISVVAVPASSKGRWPIARLLKKFPQFCDIKDLHARDALQLGLSYIEKTFSWKPS